MLVFTLSVYAKEFSITNAEEFESAVADFNANGGDVTFNLNGDLTGLSGDVTLSGEGNLVWNYLGDVTVDKRIIFKGKINLEMNLNGYTAKTVNVNGGGANGLAYWFNNKDGVYTIKNGRMESSDVVLWTSAGTFLVEDVTLLGVEEGIYSSGQSSFFKITVRRCTMSGLSVVDAAEGGLIEDCIITPGTNGGWFSFNTDAWGTSADLKQDFIIRNVKSSDGRALSLSLTGGYQDFYVYDSDYTNISCGKDSAGYGYVEAITSPTCTKEGLKKIYADGSVTEEVLSKIAHDLDENTVDGIEYENYFAKGSRTGLCAVCNEKCKEETPSADALFESLGYSASTYTNGISVIQGYKINKNAVAVYNGENDIFEIGVVAAGNTSGETVLPDFNSENVISRKLDLANEYVDIRITGITENIGENTVILCLYIKDDTGVHFLENGETLDKVLGIGYSEILNLK